MRVLLPLLLILSVASAPSVALAQMADPAGNHLRVGGEFAPAEGHLRAGGTFAPLGAEPPGEEEVYVIFDSDYDSDRDDVNALANLIELEKLGTCVIIAGGASQTHDWSPAAMDATLAYYDRLGVPVGALRPDLTQAELEALYGADITDGSNYATLIGNSAVYGHPSFTRMNQPDPVETYRAALEALPPGAKARLIVVGPPTNAARLLERYPALVNAHISELHVMGGKYRESLSVKGDPATYRAEHNFIQAPSATHYLINNWPPSIPLYVHGFHVGFTVRSGGEAIRDALLPDHPVRVAYDNSTVNPEGRDSWDPITAVAAVYGFEDLGGIDLTLTEGTIEVDANGHSRFTASPGGPHTRVERDYDSGTATILGDWLDTLYGETDGGRGGPPTVASPLLDVTGTVGDPDVTVDLRSTFSDPSEQALSFGLVGDYTSASLDGDGYTLRVSHDAEADEAVLVRATNEDLLTVDDAFTVSVSEVAVPAEPPPGTDTGLRLDSFPNPAVGRATLRFTLPAPAAVSLACYDARGRRAATLAAGEPFAAGVHERALPRTLAAGRYLCRLDTERGSVTEVVTLATR